jgi:hypothetical protein
VAYVMRNTLSGRDSTLSVVSRFSDFMMLTCGLRVFGGGACSAPPGAAAGLRTAETLSYDDEIASEQSVMAAHSSRS